MKSFKGSLIFLTIALSALFLLNTGLMYVFFGINALNPVQREDSPARGSLSANSVSPPSKNGGAGAETGIEGYAAAGAPEAADEYPAAGAGPGTAGTDSAAAKGYMTLEEVQYLGELSLQDKLAALTVLSKIGSSESDRIYQLAADGVTYAEMEEIRAMLEKKLSEADMEVLYGILDKSRRLYTEEIADKNEKGRQAVDAR
jgi:hypothetical protein